MQGTFYGHQQDQDSHAACSYSENRAGTMNLTWTTGAAVSLAMNSDMFNGSKACGMCVMYRGGPLSPNLSQCRPGAESMLCLQVYHGKKPCLLSLGHSGLLICSCGCFLRTAGTGWSTAWAVPICRSEHIGSHDAYVHNALVCDTSSAVSALHEASCCVRASNIGTAILQGWAGALA